MLVYDFNNFWWISNWQLGSITIIEYFKNKIVKEVPVGTDFHKKLVYNLHL